MATIKEKQIIELIRNKKAINKSKGKKTLTDLYYKKPEQYSTIRFLRTFGIVTLVYSLINAAIYLFITYAIKAADVNSGYYLGYLIGAFLEIAGFIYLSIEIATTSITPSFMNTSLIILLILYVLETYQSLANDGLPFFFIAGIIYTIIALTKVNTYKEWFNGIKK